MNRAVLEALIPPLIALVISFVLLRQLIRLSGARLDLSRLKKVHSCEQGGVQSLSFVLTLPLFIMIVMFIVQVAQLMFGLMTIHYAAYAAARAAIVWTPAHIEPSEQYAEEYENVLYPPTAEEVPITMSFDNGFVVEPTSDAEYETSYKLNKMFAAAVMGIAPICPSRAVVYPISYDQAGISEQVIHDYYQTLDPQSYNTNSRVADRVSNKFNYAWQNTELTLSFVDKDTYNGPTYNPRVLRIVDGWIVTGPDGDWIRDWNRHEIGWQDPLTLTVTHDFALLPGPGRFLAKYLVRSDGQDDRTAARIDTQLDRPFVRPTYTVRMSASATMTSEGFKPLLKFRESSVETREFSNIDVIFGIDEQGRGNTQPTNSDGGSVADEMTEETQP